MEEIINKLIALDINAVGKVKDIKEKKENIETYVNEKLKVEKQKIDSKFLYKRKKTQEKYDLMFEDNKQELDKTKNEQIRKIEERYEQNKEDILEELINSII